MRSVVFTITLTLAITAILGSAALGASSSNLSVYPLSTCLVSGEPLGVEGEAVILDHNGREVRFCGKECAQVFEKDPSAHLKKLDQAIIDDQLSFYPLDTCVVTGEALDGENGGPADYVHGNRLVRFCCMGCRADFDKNAASYIAKLDEAAVAAQVESYPSDTCPVSKMKLGGMGEPHDYVYAGRLVRFCCAGCIDSFDANPRAALTAVYGEVHGGETQQEAKSGGNAKKSSMRSCAASCGASCGASGCAVMKKSKAE